MHPASGEEVGEGKKERSPSHSNHHSHTEKARIVCRGKGWVRTYLSWDTQVTDFAHCASRQVLRFENTSNI